MNIKEINIDNIESLDSLSLTLSSILKTTKQQQILFLEGNLGSGKTTFVQHLLKHLGINERIKSPTYTLIEPYQTQNQKVYHLDLYRLQHAHELENLGFADLLKEEALFLIEWPEKLKTFNIQPNLSLHLTLLPNEQRTVKLIAHNDFWQQVLTKES